MKAIQTARSFINDMTTKARFKLMQLRGQEATPMQLALLTAARDDEALEEFKNEHSLNTYCVPIFSDPDAWLATPDGQRFMREEFVFPMTFRRLVNKPVKSTADINYLNWYIKVMAVWDARKAKEIRNISAEIRDTCEAQLTLDQTRLDAWHALHGHKREFIREAMTWLRRRRQTQLRTRAQAA